MIKHRAANPSLDACTQPELINAMHHCKRTKRPIG